MKIVPIDQIPKNATNVPDDADAVYKTCVKLEKFVKTLDGVGIAAVQVGLPLKLFVAKVGRKYRYFANCAYTAANPDNPITIVSREGCLSILDKNGELIYYNVPRLKEVIVVGKEIVLSKKKPVFTPFNSTFSDELATVFQHEIDHQLSILISDIGTRI